MTTVGERLLKTRRARGLSQRELAERCGAGVSFPYISRIEGGTRSPSVKAIRKLARELDVTPEWLETGIDPPDIERARRSLLVLTRCLRRDATFDSLEVAERAEKFLHRALDALDPTADRGKVVA